MSKNFNNTEKVHYYVTQVVLLRAKVQQFFCWLAVYLSILYSLLYGAEPKRFLVKQVCVSTATLSGLARKTAYTYEMTFSCF